MGIYNSIDISTTDFSQRVSSLVNYLDGIEGITAVEATQEYDSKEFVGADFSLDSNSIQGFYGYYYDSDNNETNVLVQLYNGSNALIAPATSEYSGIADVHIHTYISEECVILAIKDAAQYCTGIQFMYLTADNGYNLIGYKELYTQNTDTFVDISQLIFENIMDTARIQYTYTNMFPYTAAAGTIDFLAQGYFVNNQIRKYKSSFLKECSTVTLLSTVSLPSPLDNHLAIGAHCLVPVEEGGN